jgi:hypothetical protein
LKYGIPAAAGGRRLWLRADTTTSVTTNGKM